MIASRESRLAMWQAEHVKAQLLALYPRCDVVIEGMTTRGDQILDRALSKVGGKGLFVKELEVALLSGRCDIAVHSLKDVPMTLADGFALGAILEREDPRDAWVSDRYAFEALPQGAVIGTSSLRRAAQLSNQRPDLKVVPLRGNLDTRLAKLDRGDFDGIVLAAAGLSRLGLSARIAQYLDVETCLPAPGQGTLGIEILSERTDLASWLAPLDHPFSRVAALCERQLSRSLGGSCEVPLGAYARVDDTELYCKALVASEDGQEIIRAQGRAPHAHAERLGMQLADELLARGAARLVPNA